MKRLTLTLTLIAKKTKWGILIMVEGRPPQDVEVQVVLAPGRQKAQNSNNKTRKIFVFPPP